MSDLKYFINTGDLNNQQVLVVCMRKPELSQLTCVEQGNCETVDDRRYDRSVSEGNGEIFDFTGGILATYYLSKARIKLL